MKQNFINTALTLLISSTLGFSALAQAADLPAAEAALNAPVPGSVEVFSRPADAEFDALGAYRMPTFQAGWGLPRDIYENAVRYYEAYRGRLSNQRYVAVVNFRQRSSTRRLYLFDLSKGTVEKHLVAHGAGSDPSNSGYATRFSNEDSTHMSSVGMYITDATYSGGHGYSLRLRGMEASNSAAYDRVIVMHPADYVSERVGKAGRSWGCPAVDPKVSVSMINRLKGGAMLYMTR